MSNPCCVTDTGRNLCNNEQLRSDLHSYHTALMHWDMLIQPISVICNLMIKCFISQPVHRAQWDSDSPEPAEGPHAHSSSATTASFPIQELVLIRPMMWALLPLSPRWRGILVWHKREVTFTSIGEEQVVSVQKLVLLEDSPFLSLSCPLAMWGWMEN